MPSVTTIDGYTFNNWGPVTTTFTPPASCATSTAYIEIGLIRSDTPYFMYDQQCSTIGYWDCIPSGTESKAAITASTVGSNPKDAFQAVYFSPGLYCPSGWATVGIAASEGSTLSASGILSTASPTYYPDIPEFENPATLILDLLDPSETVVMCCPSSMAADVNVGCYSILPDYKPTEGCYREFPQGDLTQVTRTATVNGTAEHYPMETLIGTTPITSVHTTTFTGDEISSLVGATYMPMVTLVHQESDVKATGTGVKATGTGNAAARLVPRSWDGFGAVFALSVAAMALGAAIILPY